MDRSGRTLEPKSILEGQFARLDEDWQQAICQVYTLHSQLTQRLVESLVSAGLLVKDGVLPSRNAQQRKDTLEDTIRNWVQEFLYHLNGYRIAARHSLEDLKHIFEDHKVIKLYVEQASQILENYPQRLQLPTSTKQFVEEQNSLLSMLAKTQRQLDLDSRKGMLNLDPQPHSRTRGMQKTEICQLYKTHYGYLSPRVKNPMFFGETQMEEMKKKVLRLEGELATQTLTVTSLRREYQAIEQRLTQARGSLEQQQHRFQTENHHLQEQNSMLQEQILSLQSSIATMQQASFRTPLQTKDTLRSRLTTRSSFRGASSQPPQRGTTLDDVKDEFEGEHQVRNSQTRNRQYFDIGPSEAEKSYHSSRENLSATLRQVQTLRETIIKERKLREELERRLIDRELSESSQRTGNFHRKLEIEEQAAESLHKTKLEYEDKLFRLQTEKSNLKATFENDLSNLRTLLETQKNLTLTIQAKLESSERCCREHLQTIEMLQGELESVTKQFEKAKSELRSALASAAQPPVPVCPNSPPPPRSPISRLERSGSSYSPFPKGPAGLLDMSMNDPVFKTGTCENCEGGSGLSRRLQTDTKKDQEIVELREKLLTKRNEITLMQERELSQQRAFHSEVQVLQEGWARERSEFQMRISMLQQEQKRLEDSLQSAKGELAQQSSSSTSLTIVTTKLKLLESSLKSAEDQLQAHQTENAQLRQYQSQYQSRLTEAENLAREYVAAHELIQQKLQKQTEECRVLLEREKHETLSQSKGLTGKFGQLEALLQELEEKFLGAEQKIRELKDSLEQSQDSRAILSKRFESLKEQTRYALIKLTEKYRRDLYNSTTQLQDTVSSKIRGLEDRVLGLKSKLASYKCSTDLQVQTSQEALLKVSKLEAAYAAERAKLGSLQTQHAHEQQEAARQTQKLKDDLARQSAAAKSQLSDLEAEFSRTLKDLRTQKDLEAATLLSDLECLRLSASKDKRQADHLTAAVSDLETRNQRLKDTTETLTTANEQLQQQLTRTKDLCAQTVDEGDRKDEKVRQVQHALDRLRVGCEELRGRTAETEVLRERVAEVSRGKKVLEAEVERVRGEIRSQKESLEQVHRAEVEKYRAELTTKGDEIRNLTNRLEELASENAHKAKLASMAQVALQEQLAAEKQSVSKLQASLQSKEEEWASERRTLTNKQAEVLKQQESTSAELQTKLLSLVAQFEEAKFGGEKAAAQSRKDKDAIEDLERKLKKQKSLEDELSNALRNVQQELMTQKGQSHVNQTELQALQRKMVESEKAYLSKEETYKSQLETCKQQAVQQTASFEKRVAEMQAENLKSSQVKLEAMQLELQAQHKLALTTKDAQIYQLQQQISELERQLSKLKSEIGDISQTSKDFESKLSSQVKLLQEEKSLLTKSLEQLRSELIQDRASHENQIKNLKLKFEEMKETELKDLSDKFSKERKELVQKGLVDLEQLKAELLKDSDAAIQKMKAGYEIQLQQSLDQKKGLQSELEVARTSMSEGEKALKASLSEALKLSSDRLLEIEKFQTSLKALQSRETELQESVAQTQQAFNDAQQTVATLETQVTTWKQKTAECETDKQQLTTQLKVYTDKVVVHRQVQTETEVCDATEAKTQVQKLEGLLVLEKTAAQELKDKFAVDKSKLLEKLAWLEKELARQKDQIMDKLMDIKSLRQSRDLELAHFKISVEEFNKQLEEERRVFNQQLRDLDEQKKVQFDMLNKKVKELESQRDKERELYRSMQTEQGEQSQMQQELEDYQKKDSAIKEMIEQYKRELERLKSENTDLRSENMEAMKSIREFLSRIDPEESPEQMKGFKFDEALEKLSQRMSGTPIKGVNLAPKIVFTRTQSVLNVNVDDNLNDSLGTELDSGYKRPSTTNEFLGGGKDMARSMGMKSATTSPLTKRKTIHTSKVVETMEESDNDSTPEQKVEMGLQVVERKFVLELEPVKTETVEPSRIAVYNDQDSNDFKLGRSLAEVPLPKRQFKPKFQEVLTYKEAKTRIKSMAHVKPIMLSRGRPAIT